MASRLFAEGRNAVQVQRWLGHLSPSFTLDTYVHLLDGDFGQPLESCLAQAHADVLAGRRLSVCRLPQTRCGTIPSRRYIGTSGDSTQQPTADQGQITIDARARGTGTPTQNVVDLCGSIIPTPCTGSSVLDRQALSDVSVSAGLVDVTNYSFSDARTWLRVLTLR